ncbi:hypothetical protein NECAME_00789 [Necator americanus]|uniref:Uncharacterized protein n=1 Tax=Necator americanus TaxID=51031 RepID=W2SVL7_NECAM|nr:hypothetical protein NECAME_00789 [Necator americanus]ETN73700.1 hypothetical protein NECAME_00789 [Necator americanus]
MHFYRLPPVFEEEDMYERENWSLFPSNSWFLTNGAFVSTHSPHTHVDSNGFTMAPSTVESKNRNIIDRQDTQAWIDSDGCRLRTLVALSRVTSVFARYCFFACEKARIEHSWFCSLVCYFFGQLPSRVTCNHSRLREFIVYSIY